MFKLEIFREKRLLLSLWDDRARDSRVVIGLQATEDTGAAETDDAVGF